MSSQDEIRLARAQHGSRTFVGIVNDGQIVDVSQALSRLPNSVRAILAMGAPAFKAIRELAPAQAIDLTDVRLLAPVPDPGKFLGIGLNYRDHASEAARHGIDAPAEQLWFNKQTTCVSGPYDEIVRPTIAEQLDYEGELAAVIGARCRGVAKGDALRHVAGYMVCNDVSVREWQFRSPTITLGKSHDTHGPTGPWLTVGGEISPRELRTYVNGELRQRASTSEMIHDVAAQIAYLSTFITLEPGDIIATGTPSGVGFSRQPQAFLAPGDVVRVEIDGLGHIENLVVAERE